MLDEDQAETILHTHLASASAIAPRLEVITAPTSMTRGVLTYLESRIFWTSCRYSWGHCGTARGKASFSSPATAASRVLLKDTAHEYIIDHKEPDTNDRLPLSTCSELPDTDEIADFDKNYLDQLTEEQDGKHDTAPCQRVSKRVEPTLHQRLNTEQT